MGNMIEMTGDEATDAVTASMLRGVVASGDNKDRVADLLLQVAMERYGSEYKEKYPRGLFRPVRAKSAESDLYTVFVMVGSEVTTADRIALDKAMAG